MSEKPYHKFLVIILIIINIILLSLFFKPSSDVKITKVNQEAWRFQDYKEFEELKNNNWDFQQTAQFFKDLAADKGGEYAYHSLAVALAHGFIAPNIDAHLLGHIVGDILYKQKGIDGIKVCTDDIRNACSHSIVVGYLLDNGEEALFKAVETCKQAPGGRGAYTMCVHGLGHGVLGYTEYDMRKAVALCSKTGTEEYNNKEIGQCVGGVTMEMMAGIHDKKAWAKQIPNYLKANDPLSPCNMGFIPEGALNYCYAYLTPRLFEMAGADMSFPNPKYFSKAMSFCGALPKGDRNRARCFGSFGKEYVVLANARNVESVINMKDDKLKLVYDWCNLGPREALSPCLDSALESFYWGGENEPDVSIRFCQIIPDNEEKDVCMKRLFSLVAFYFENDNNYQKTFCNKVGEAYKEECQFKFFKK